MPRSHLPAWKVLLQGSAHNGASEVVTEPTSNGDDLSRCGRTSSVPATAREAAEREQPDERHDDSDPQAPEDRDQDSGDHDEPSEADACHLHPPRWTPNVRFVPGGYPALARVQTRSKPSAATSESSPMRAALV